MTTDNSRPFMTGAQQVFAQDQSFIDKVLSQTTDRIKYLEVRNEELNLAVGMAIGGLRVCRSIIQEEAGGSYSDELEILIGKITNILEGTNEDE